MEANSSPLNLPDLSKLDLTIPLNKEMNDLSLNLPDLSKLDLSKMILPIPSSINLDLSGINLSKLNITLKPTKSIDKRPPLMNFYIDPSTLIDIQCGSSERKVCSEIRCKDCYYKSFASHEKSKYWSSKNKLTPRDSCIGYCSKIYFNCPTCLHELYLPAGDIIKDRWCPYCSVPAKKLCDDNDCELCFNNSFASTPYAKNWVDEINCRTIFKQSNKRYKFKCPTCNHDITCCPNSLIQHGKWQCSYCGRKSLCEKENCKMCFDNSFASSDKAKYWSKSNNILPRQVFRCGSTAKYKFNCDKCPHEFDMAPEVVSRGHWCPYCNSGRLCGNKECKTCWDKSFANHPRTANLVDKTIETWKINMTTTDEYQFKCDDCQHIFDKRICHIRVDSWCAYCAHLRLCDNDECKFCFNNSFASHPEVYRWSVKNSPLLPRQVFKHSSEKYYLDCSKCGHVYQRALSSQGCVYCSHLELCNNINCNYCFLNSFASHPQAKYWSYKNEIKPRDLFRTTHYAFIFNCMYCNEEYERPLSGMSEGSGCKTCRNKTEQLLKDYLEQHFETKFQPKFEWCKNDKTNCYLYFDFLLASHNILIELDGDQHFMEITLFTCDPEDIRYRDVLKMKLALEHGYSVIRLSQPEVWSGKINLDISLLPLIKLYSTPTVKYLTYREDLYTNHITDLNIRLSNQLPQDHDYTTEDESQ